MADFKVVVLEEATKEMMMKEQYKRLYEYGEEHDVMCECDEIDKKLDNIDEWRRHKSKCGYGYKNRRK